MLNSFSLRRTFISAIQTTYAASTSQLVFKGRTYCDFPETSQMDYEKKSEETLSKLADYLDTLPDIVPCDSDYDVNYSMGVLTAKFGRDIGTYVLNKQSPNKQIWLSSPFSGPKRYDLSSSGRWIYKHDNQSLHELLEKEFQRVFKTGKKTCGDSTSVPAPMKDFWVSSCFAVILVVGCATS
uniref:ferroxidase n=1 Tax=Ditylenchus dipsaci TaxID=166011 RepID=A0A915DN02_9BILA